MSAPIGLKPAWQRINDLFAKNGLTPPPTRLRDELVAHLTAYDLRALPAAPAVKVKPLVWRDENDDGVLTCRAQGILRRIFPQSDGTFFAPLLRPSDFPSADAAIAAFFAQHEARILSALEIQQ